jgi:DNA-directed RNA polymerase specialized sigma24 family protein
MTGDGSVTHWLNQLAGDDDSVAQRALFDRYFAKLVELGQQKLNSAPRAVEDEEDLALSAMDSFFRRAADGQFPLLAHRHELWSLLVTIVTRKAVNRLKKERALKRGWAQHGTRPAVLNGSHQGASPTELMAGDPTPDALAEMDEEFHRRLASLDDELLRDVALLRLQGFTNEEIAGRLGVAERTVRRKINRIRREWMEAVD